MSDHDVCPWWVGYLLANPLRRLVQKPEKILMPYVKEGMTVMDVGSAMGFFTLPLAKLVGDQGRVIAVDLQEKMIRSLKRRAQKAGLASRIETRICSSESLGIDDLADSVDVALAFAVLHEMPDSAAAILSIAQSLRSGGLFLMAEPTGHVSTEGFRQTSEAALQQGLEVVSKPVISRSHAVVMRKPSV
jgi:ubiquinone/menaquinone biosynthesis C-methylase UbiE